MRDYRYGSLDGVRGLAAQAVLFGHGIELAFLSGPGTAAALTSWFSRLAVMTFFGLSGFVIAVSLRRLVERDPRRFLLAYAVHRVARILPPLVFAVTIAFGVAALGRAGLPLVDLRDPNPTLGLAAYLRGITLTFAPSDATFALDGPLWSLRQECFLYGLAALAALAWTRAGLARLAAAAAAIGLLVLVSDRFFYLQSFVLFGCGALAALFGSRPTIRRAAASRWPALAFAGLALAPILALPLDARFLEAMSNAPGFLAYQAALGIPLALTLLGLATGDGPIARGLARLSGAAAFSYTLYVVHNPILVLAFSLRAATGALPGIAGAAATLALAVAASEVVAFGAARVLERPKAFRALAFKTLARVGLSDRGEAAEPARS